MGSKSGRQAARVELLLRCLAHDECSCFCSRLWGVKKGSRHTRYNQKIQFHGRQQDGSVNVEGELHFGRRAQHSDHYTDGTQGRPAIALEGQHPRNCQCPQLPGSY